MSDVTDLGDLGAPGMALSPEDAARVDFYALLSRLYAAGPDRPLLQMLAQAPAMKPESEDGEALARAWAALIDVSAASSPDSVGAEYQDLFIGVGRSEVSLHAAAYVTASGSNTLAGLRQTLTSLELARKQGTTLYEDHLSAVLEIMRLLIERGAGGESYAFAAQHKFFAQHVQPWVFECCIAIKRAPVANYYRHVAEFTSKFMVIERDSFAVG